MSISLHSHQQYMMFPATLHYCQHLIICQIYLYKAVKIFLNNLTIIYFLFPGTVFTKQKYTLYVYGMFHRIQLYNYLILGLLALICGMVEYYYHLDVYNDYLCFFILLFLCMFILIPQFSRSTLTYYFKHLHMFDYKVILHYYYSFIFSYHPLFSINLIFLLLFVLVNLATYLPFFELLSINRLLICKLFD